ncbi:DUF4062 domain-containing protein, partial [Aliivibrio sifiae]
VAHCDMFVLIISGRYGGKFKGGNGESITQAEYNKARDLGLPIFTFVKADVSAAQHYYKENIRVHDEEFAKKINYPGIQQQNDAVSIFSFIDSVHRSDTNNGIETYQSFTDIECHLKKQWAGMFFSFLQKRNEHDKVEAMASILNKLAGSSSKLEVLVGSLHDKEVGKDETSKLLEESKLFSNCIEFYSGLIKNLDLSAWDVEPKDRKQFVKSNIMKLTSSAPKGELEDYLSSLPNISFTTREDKSNTTGEHVIQFTKRSSAKSLQAPVWVKMLKLYNESILKSNSSIRNASFNEALERYMAI